MYSEYRVVHKKTGKPIEVKIDWAGWEDIRFLAYSDSWKNTVFGWGEIASSSYKLRILKEKKSGKVLGAYAFSLDTSKGCLYINCIESVAKGEMRLVGTMLMRDAVEQSIINGFDGRVKLISRWVNDEASAPENFFSKIGMIKECGNIHCLDADVKIDFWNFSFDEEGALEFLDRFKKGGT